MIPQCSWVLSKKKKAQRKAILACILLQVVLVLLLLSGSVGRESRCFASLNHDLQCQPRRPSHEIPNKHPKKWEQVLASVRNQPIQSKYLARRTLEETVRADGRQGCCSNLHGAKNSNQRCTRRKDEPGHRAARRGGRTYLSSERGGRHRRPTGPRGGSRLLGF